MSLFSFTITYSVPPPVQQQVSGGAWGTGAWGTGSWGASQAAPPQISSVSPGVVDTLGGTVITIAGTNFNRSAVVSVLESGQVVGLGSIADLDFDLTANKIFSGMPALPTGFYDLQVATNGGTALLTNAFEVREFAYEFKTEDVRRKWARAWNLGTRQLGSGG